MGKVRTSTISAVKGGSKKNSTNAKAKSEVKTRRKPTGPAKSSGPLSHKQQKKKRVYSDAELGIPKLNGIVPTGIVKTKGKKGKVFVDDAESVKAIFSMVHAEKEGHIESKLAKARQLEEIREAKRQKAEEKQAEKQAKLDEVKNGLRRKRKRDSGAITKPDEPAKRLGKPAEKENKPKSKRVSFA